MQTTVIGVYWSARADDVSGCTGKALQHFRMLTQVAGLDHWSCKTMRKVKVPDEVDVTSAEVVTGLWQANRRDSDGKIISELGWSLALWSGGALGSTASTSLHCGCTSERVRNAAVVEVNRSDARALEAATAVELLKGMVELWNADTGAAYRAEWDEDRKCHLESEIASYKRRRRPLLLRRNEVRHAQGVIRLAV